ncbi:MAG: hypothetical protein ONB46_17175 [candidate division KSB1 bacterium]|nr:hypothetical protein [candidate division KSB1 bacterium]MDZ7367432.1 hypothetical protein [candidate division KSB1 bacterium]MDZ7405463.1 hypothetical protein [candidate division KSB1 bacterium]
MRANELCERSLDLGLEFSRYVLEHPRFAERIPYGAQVVLLPTYDKELREYNLRNAQINAETGRPVVHIEIDRLRPRRSQIVKPRLKTIKKASTNGNTSRHKKTKLAHA